MKKRAKKRGVRKKTTRGKNRRKETKEEKKKETRNKGRRDVEVKLRKSEKTVILKIFHEKCKFHLNIDPTVHSLQFCLDFRTV